MRICIDVGHGGTDSGAAYNGYLEKNLNLAYAKAIYTILTEYNCDVFLTRKDDMFIELNQRAKWIYDYNPDVCISCHMNAGGGSGTEAILSLHAPDYVKALATMITKNISKTFGLKNRGTYSRESSKSTKNNILDYYAVHRKGSPNVIILEPLFLDSNNDIKLVKNDKFIDNLAFTVANTIITALKLTVKKSGDKPVPDDLLTKPHWAEPYYNKLLEHGIKIDNRDFDKNITRGEVFALICKLLDAKQ
jgi:N-acetylmuramoyl-L-alanine amidase